MSIKLLSRNKLSILTYHRVGQNCSTASMDAELFEKQLIWLKNHFNPIGLSAGIELQRKGALPKGSVAITVDDGYADSYDVILPLLKKHGLTAAFFVSTDGLNKGYLWDEQIAFNIEKTHVESINFHGVVYPLLTANDRDICIRDCLAKVKYYPIIERKKQIAKLLEQTGCLDISGRFLTPKTLVELAVEGMEVGAHTHSHPILTTEDDEKSYDEIKRSKTILEDILDKPVHLFAYPNGKYAKDYGDNHISMVKELGFKAALSTDWGVLSDQNADLYSIKRFTPWDESELSFCFRLLLNYKR